MPPHSRQGPRRVAWALGAVALVGAVGAALVAMYLPSNAALAQRATAALTQAVGAPVQVGALHWQLLPRPAVVLTDVVAGPSAGEPDAKPALTLQRITLVPEVSWATLQSRRLRLLQARVEGAVVQQRALAALGGAVPKDRVPDTPATQTANPAIPLEQLVWQQVTWVPRHGAAVVVAGAATFDADWRPRTATLQLPDAKVTADLTLTRQGQDDRWAVQGHLGGGTAKGELALHTLASAWALDGTLALQGIGVADALQAVNRQPVVSGLANGTTVVSARSTFTEGPAQLLKSLHTDTRFSMGRSLLLRFDVDKAVRSAGSDTKGQTPLDSVTGTMATQNSATGMVIDFSNVKAESGALSASGRARLANRQLEAEVSVDLAGGLVGGLVGIPLRITGPVGALKVSVAPGALAGAAAGTAVLPGVGTALGARVGAALGKLFGKEPPAPGKSAPRQP